MLCKFSLYVRNKFAFSPLSPLNWQHYLRVRGKSAQMWEKTFTVHLRVLKELRKTRINFACQDFEFSGRDSKRSAPTPRAEFYICCPAAPRQTDAQHVAKY
jgi:hypothetical protein